jgi:PhnB protein
MKIIQKLCFSGETEEALEEYRRAFGCTIRNLLHYSDAVKNG